MVNPNMDIEFVSGMDQGVGMENQFPPEAYAQEAPVYGYDGTATEGYDIPADEEQIPDVLLLNYYCSMATPPEDSSEEARNVADYSWEEVREWLRSHDAEQVREAAQQRGDSSQTALHIACGKVPPVDVIEVLLSIAGDTAQWQDFFGWLPIHYACAYGADAVVIEKLAEAFPDSKTTVDKRGRTPLHFALGSSNQNSPVSPEVVVLLSSTGAASYPDDNGMLPLHYACAYGAPEEALYVLTDIYSDAITTSDLRGRTPLHFALSNAGRKAAPAAVRLLLTLHRESVNATPGGPLPLRVLAEYAATIRDGEESQRESILRCLEHLLGFNPDPTADFFTALQSLPSWLQERAVVMSDVQVLLNVKIAQRFPTGVLLSDFFVQLVVIGFYAKAVPDATERRLAEASIYFGDSVDSELLIPLYVGAAYFLGRTFIQILSLLALGAAHVWFQDPSNWLDIIYILAIFFSAYQMGQGIATDESYDEEDQERLRTGLAVTVVVIWMKLLAYLRNTYIDFAVFLGGLFYVVRRLVAFLVCLCVTLIAFSQMWFTLYRDGRDGERCSPDNNPYDFEDELKKEQFFLDAQCDNLDSNWVYCDRWTAFLNTFTMLIGEVNGNQFQDNYFAIALFVLFMFLVVILLANVLIAIVADSYKVIQDQRAAIVFWTNRLDFIAEMDAIANGPWKNRVRNLIGLPVVPSNKNRAEVTFGKETWKRLMDLYEDDIEDGALSLEFACYTFLRAVTAVIIIPAWVVFGLLSFGSMWPPQVRQWVFTSKVKKHSSEAEKDNEMRRIQIQVLKQEVQTLKDDLLQELAVDRTQVVQTKSLVAQRKTEIQAEMKHIKRIVAMLFEQQSSMYGE
eukprot:Nitzschia sp. Nitz4//scaffold137_size62074//14398//17094//NITZ4_006409-RA/size62074-processed-gene-0.81-mRNA-1//-1//CDS//3329535682//7803//frame0